MWCECSKGEAKNTGHICQLLTNERQNELYFKSEQECPNREQKMQVQSILGLDPYDEKEHRKWYNVYNSGVSHFACVTEDFNIKKSDLMFSQLEWDSVSLCFPHPGLN